MAIDTNLTAMLEKVQNLWARAEHPNTPPAEADTARTMAERIMRKYRLEEEEVRQAKLASGTAPEPVVVEFTYADVLSPYSSHYWSMMYYVAGHVGIRVKSGSKKVQDEETGELRWVQFVTMVGFDSDVQLAQLLYANLRATFSEKLEPKVSPALSDEDNVYRLRSAGVERIRIAQIMWGSGSHANNAKVSRLYAAACAARGEDPKVAGRSVNAKTFRESYADGFISEAWSRLFKMKSGAGEAGAIVLAGREEAVDEAFYAKFPALRPAAAIGNSAPVEPCKKCEKAKSGSCRDHSFRKAAPRPFSSAGWGAGTFAAREADLSRAGTPAKPKLGA